jgi:pSer/pThr/pTyr-binding forkhead associated (FHA) protein
LIRALRCERVATTSSKFIVSPRRRAISNVSGDIFLDDVTVSRRHAEFRLQGGEFHLVDVASLNGTYVNREPIESIVLANGDEIQMGKFRLVFLTGPPTS